MIILVLLTNFIDFSSEYEYNIYEAPLRPFWWGW